MTSHRFQQIDGIVKCARCGSRTEEAWCSRGCVGMRVKLPFKFVRLTGARGTGKVVGALSPDIVLATVSGHLFPFPFALSSVIQQEVEHVSPEPEEVTDY